MFMLKRPPQAGSQTPSRPRATYTAPRAGSQPPPPTQPRPRNASFEDERQPMLGEIGDGARTGPVTEGPAERASAPYEGLPSMAGARPPTPHWEGRVPPRQPALPRAPGGSARATNPAPRESPPQAIYTPPRRAGDQPPIRSRTQDGRRHAVPEALAGGTSAATEHPSEHVTTIQDDVNAAPHDAMYPPVGAPGHEKRQSMARCLITACCILFWLLIFVIGLAILIIYLLYRPRSPRLGVAAATLNAGYLDELNGSLALNSDVTVLANISNPNTKNDVILHYMELDLFFRGNLIATQVVWPAPLHEVRGESVLRSVHLVASKVTMTEKDVAVWQNATSPGGQVQLRLAGRFWTQLNFGRWLRYTYWIYPSCSIFLDNPPSGALLSAQC